MFTQKQLYLFEIQCTFLSRLAIYFPLLEYAMHQVHLYSLDHFGLLQNSLLFGTFRNKALVPCSSFCTSSSEINQSSSDSCISGNAVIKYRRNTVTLYVDQVMSLLDSPLCRLYFLFSDYVQLVLGAGLEQTGQIGPTLDVPHIARRCARGNWTSQAIGFRFYVPVPEEYTEMRRHCVLRALQFSRCLA